MTAPAQPVQGVEAVAVKPLLWEDRELNHPRFRAESVTGVYYISRTPGGLWKWWTAALRGSIEVRTIDDAKAAAQADYEARVRSALLPREAPAAVAEAVAAEREACLQIIQTTLRHRAEYGWMGTVEVLSEEIRAQPLASPAPAPEAPAGDLVRQAAKGLLDCLDLCGFADLDELQGAVFDLTRALASQAYARKGDA